jgi:putative transposase
MYGPEHQPAQRREGGCLGGALEDALLRRFGVLPAADIGVVLRTDNALVYVSELYRRLAKSYGLNQEFILPHTPEQNGVAESFMGTLKLECIWQHRFATYEEAKATISLDPPLQRNPPPTRAWATSRRRRGASARPN